MKYFLSWFTLMFPLLLAAQGRQGQALIDSLQQELANSKTDTVKLRLLNEICFRYYDIDPDKGIQYGTQALELAEQLGRKQGIATAYTYLGANLYNKSDYPKALDAWYKALSINQELGNKSGEAKNLMQIGRIYVDQNSPAKSLDYYHKSLKIYQQLHVKNEVAHNLSEIGSVYLLINDYPRALEYYNEALHTNEALADTNGMADNIGNIGTAWFSQQNYPRALAYYFRALQMNRKLGDKSSVAINLGNIGECYYLVAKDTTGTIKPDSLVLRDKAANLAKSIDFLTQAINMARDIHFLNAVQEYSRYLADAYELHGDIKSAYASYKQFVAAKDSIFNTENNIKITNLETRRDLALKDKQIQIDRLEVAKKQDERIYFISGMAALVLVMGFIFRSNKLLSKEKKRSDDLLLNILPSEVAEELKDTGMARARHFANVTVLFTDFVNFTNAGVRMTPQALVDELHACFRAFDQIIDKYDIEKIKTIGDAYLAVAGLPVADPAHAVNIVRAAQEITHFMQERYARLGDSTFQVRVGIHSGSVVAGIVGLKKFSYDIWGDTVNTAARLEQSSEPGRINISETTYALVKDTFNCAYRGEVEAKGKGVMKMYYVV